MCPVQGCGRCALSLCFEPEAGTSKERLRQGVLSSPGTSEQGSHAAVLGAVGFSPPGCLSHGNSGCGREQCGMLGGQTDSPRRSHTSHLGKCAWCLGSCCPAPLTRCLSPKPVLIARRLSGKWYQKVPNRLVAQGQAPQSAGACGHRWVAGRGRGLCRSHAVKYALVLSLRGKLLESGPPPQAQGAAPAPCLAGSEVRASSRELCSLSLWVCL